MVIITRAHQWVAIWIRQLVRREHVETTWAWYLKLLAPYGIATPECNACRVAKALLGSSAAAKMEQFQIDAMAGYQARSGHIRVGKCFARGVVLEILSNS